jgi:7-carboxy-7-deazaguanine synthase
MSTYQVKEIFLTLQGEGAHTGRRAVFCRFAGCNLWSGREKDRAEAVCQFCDTDFVGTDGENGGRYPDAQTLAAKIASVWGETVSDRFVVLTGGEPLLQLDQALVEALHAKGFFIAIETNGTQRPPPSVDWICVSPKAGAPLVLTQGQELKLVFPQTGLEPEIFVALAFENFFLQPMDGENLARNTQMAIAYCLKNPRWRLSLQTHKLIGIP